MEYAELEINTLNKKDQRENRPEHKQLKNKRTNKLPLLGDTRQCRSHKMRTRGH